MVKTVILKALTILYILHDLQLTFTKITSGMMYYPNREMATENITFTVAHWFLLMPKRNKMIRCIHYILPAIQFIYIWFKHIYCVFLNHNIYYKSNWWQSLHPPSANSLFHHSWSPQFPFSILPHCCLHWSYTPRLKASKYVQIFYIHYTEPFVSESNAHASLLNHDKLAQRTALAFTKIHQWIWCQLLATHFSYISSNHP